MFALIDSGHNVDGTLFNHKADEEECCNKRYEALECCVDRRHIKIANIILRPAKAAIERKPIQKKHKMPRDSNLITHVPPSIIEKYWMVILGIDSLMIALMVSLSFFLFLLWFFF